jgi:hypothetical protein
MSGATSTWSVAFLFNKLKRSTYMNAKAVLTEHFNRAYKYTALTPPPSASTPASANGQ